MRFPNIGTRFKSNLDKSYWVSHWQRVATSRILVHDLPHDFTAQAFLSPTGKHDFTGKAFLKP